MGLTFDNASGQTPLDEEEKEGLLIKTITARTELDEFEQHNIEKAMLWLRKKKFKSAELLAEKMIREFHRRMYADVWKWAGSFRKTDKNIGIENHAISTALRQLVDDCNYWIEQRSFPEEEIAIRFKHRIVQIHCFANGNGRHSRLMADAMMEKIFNLPLFTWGSANLSSNSNTRINYIKSLKQADTGNYKELLAFAKS